MIEHTTTQQEIPRMLSIRETADLFNLPVHFVRSLVAEGKVFSVQAGSRKYYVNSDSVTAFLNGKPWIREGGAD